jgi:hypothetical protein
MKPGATASPCASTVTLAVALLKLPTPGDAIAAQRNVRLPSFAARSVVDRAVPDNDVELLRRPEKRPPR